MNPKTVLKYASEQGANAADAAEPRNTGPFAIARLADEPAEQNRLAVHHGDRALDRTVRDRRRKGAATRSY